MGILHKLMGGGVPHVDPDAAVAKVEDGALLLDVREPSEWKAGHAPGARHLPLASLGAEAGSLPKNREIVVVCRSGNRSAQATRVLRENGYDAYNLTGGMIAWQRHGHPVT